jgi:bud site selection protein 20
MGRISQSKGKKKPTGNGGAKSRRTKRRVLDFDQVHKETRAQNALNALEKRTEYDEDKPGEGQFYCLACARYFQEREILDKHNLSKRHKSVVKRLAKDEPWDDSDIHPVDNGVPLGRGKAGPAPVVQATAANAGGVSTLVGGVSAADSSPASADAMSEAQGAGASAVSMQD